MLTLTLKIMKGKFVQYWMPCWAQRVSMKEDVLAITVNRWPHGYSYEYMELWDDDYPDGQAPHEIARQPFGNIAIANTDAGAEAYTHTAIDQAFRAVNEFG